MQVSVLHEALNTRFQFMFSIKIMTLRESSDSHTKTLLAKISNHGSAGIQSKNGSVLCPGAQFTVLGQEMPGVLVETAYSQSTLQVSEKAIQYLTASNGLIQFVISLDASYNSTKSHHYRLILHVWTSSTVSGGSW
jgi:hypothetical protein